MRRSFPALLLVLVFLVACSRGGGAGGGDDGSGDDGSGSDDSSGAATGAPAGQTAAAEPTTAGEAQIAEIQQKRLAATFKVSYEWTASSGGAPSSETWYHKGKLSRVDWGEPGQPSYASHYINKDGAFICSGSGKDTTCIATAAAGDSPETLSFAATIMTIYEGLLADPSFGSTRESRSIAGQSASCWKSGAVLALGLAEVTLCYHQQSGVPLLFHWKAGSDSFQMTAKTYGTSVADSDFDLPAKPVSY